MFNLPWRVQTKAVTSNSGATTSLTTTLPDRQQLTQDPVKLMNYHRGYVFAANTKVAEAVASLPYRLYAYVTEDEAKSLVTKHCRCSDSTRKALGFPRGERKTLVEIYEHPFLNLMREPYKGWTQTEFWRCLSTYMGCIGNAYVRIHSSDGELQGLEPLQSECMTVTYDDTGAITGYDYRPQGTVKHQVFAPDQIMHVRQRMAGSIIAGMGNLEACLPAVNLMFQTQSYVGSLLQNMAVPGAIITIKNFNGTNEEGQKFKDKFIEQFGRRNRGKPVVSFGDVDYKRADATMQETRVDVFGAEAKKEISACFGVPLTLLDESNSNRATALAAKQSMQSFAVYPRAKAMLDSVNAVVARFYDPRLTYGYDSSEAVEHDPQEQAQILGAYVNNDIMTVDEARDVLGLEQRQA